MVAHPHIGADLAYW